MTRSVRSVIRVLVELATVVASLGLCGGCEPAQITYTQLAAAAGAGERCAGCVTSDASPVIEKINALA
jgi:bacterioferritin-associated ferredoxin